MSGDAGRPPDLDDATLAAAAHWHARARAGLSTAERLRLLEWLRARPEHAAAADIIARTWQAAPVAAHQGGFMISADADPVIEGSALRPRRAAWAGLAALGAVAASLLFWVAQPQSAAFSTGPNERRSATLADGTRIWLAPGTRLVAQIGPFGRDVTLERGEAAFDVVHQQRGFRVEAGDVAVVDRGTLFSVRHRAGRPIRVTLAHGALTVLDRATESELAAPRPGQQVEVKDRAVELREVEAGDALAWREGRLIFSDASLGEAVAAFEDQGASPIRLRDPSLATLRVSGAYAAADIESFLSALSSIHPVRWSRSDTGYEIGRR